MSWEQASFDLLRAKARTLGQSAAVAFWLSPQLEVTDDGLASPWQTVFGAGSWGARRAGRRVLQGGTFEVGLFAWRRREISSASVASQQDSLTPAVFEKAHDGW